ncbi:MAG: hypothetical protein EPN43_13660 [Jatrophihabitans sp.]|nr:MAG: hypothetical protein EPN43_13660 [Jatrophihabitans sp.]
MLSPVLSVSILVILWLIVIVPMVLRRNDDLRRDRSVAGFGRSMRALGRRSHAPARTEVFVPRERAPQELASRTRRPVPAAQEALMYPVDRSDMSAARVRMLTRRRRSLAILVGGSVFFSFLALAFLSVPWWPAVLFIGGLVGYLWFLRSQALRDRERRVNRQQRALLRQPDSYDATADLERFDRVPDSVVRIDDDDIELQTLDTIDLTGLYTEETPGSVAGRRAS